MTLAYSYIRFSTPEQAKGDSLRRQLTAAKKFADEHNLTLDDSLRDEGVSAFRGKNRKGGSLGAFFSKVEDGTVPPGSYLIVENLDRLSRQEVQVALRMFMTLIEHGIVVATLSDNKIYSDKSIAENPFDLMASMVFMIRSHEESAIKSKRIGEAWQRKRADAVEQKKAMTEICPGWLKKKGDSYQLIEERARIVQQIFEWVIEGDGTRTIAKRLNQNNEPTWTRKKRAGRTFWYDSYIKKILENPAVYGEFTPRAKLSGGSDKTQDETIVDYFPSVVDRETFFRARAVLSKRASSSIRSPSGKNRNILSGLIKCASCGAGMHYINKGRKGGRPYLQCGQSVLRAGCDQSTKYEYTNIEAQAVLQTSSLQHLSIEQDKGRRDAIELEIVEIAEKTERLIDAIEGIGLNASIQRRLDALEARHESLQVELSKIEENFREIKLGERLLRGRKEVADLVLQLREDPTDFVLRKNATNMMRGLIKEISLSPKRIEFRYVGSGSISTPIADESEVAAQLEAYLASKEIQTTKGKPTKVEAKLFDEIDFEDENIDEAFERVNGGVKTGQMAA